jgi:excisionase family DNA binding protein
LDDILTVRDIAARLKLAERTVNAMLSERELPGFKVRGQWRVRRADFESWLERVATGEDAQAATADITTAAPAGDAPLSAPDHVSDAAPRETHEAAPEGGRVKPLTERVSQQELHRRFTDALGRAVRSHSPLERKPLEIDLASPLPGRVRVYLFNATRPPGGRPLGEHKVQLIVPGQGRGVRGTFDHSDGRIVLLAGYAAEEDVFILWDGGLYNDFAWSRNVQVKAETIIEASAGKLAVQERRLRPTDGPAVTETLLAAPPSRLADAIVRRIELTRERLAEGAR